MFGTTKDGIKELLDEHLRDFRAEIAARHLEARTFSFQEFQACRNPEFFWVRDPVASFRWISDMENA